MGVPVVFGFGAWAGCRVGRYFLFRPPGRVTFSLHAQRESNQRESAPDHPAPAAPGFPPSGVAPGAAVQGASMPLYGFRRIHAAHPLHDACVRPPERKSVPSCLKALSFFPARPVGQHRMPLQEAGRNIDCGHASAWARCSFRKWPSAE